MRSGVEARLSWASSGTMTSVGRTGDKRELPVLWTRAPLGQSLTGGYVDAEPAPGPARPWLYQVFPEGCGGVAAP